MSTNIPSQSAGNQSSPAESTRIKLAIDTRSTLHVINQKNGIIYCLRDVMFRSRRDVNDWPAVTQLVKECDLKKCAACLEGAKAPKEVRS